ncbi:YfhO family protein [Liquorilactobacillus oeni]|uniref:Abc superfamily atp binding cassette transporter, membrane protein n=1 Tax=Liquorilactobacillus oeni DSM 19972 TaxID=1423777 RepID=A0A0R1MMG3_9LACO|nr:YfhO family protein [Liquorilactobacillus oeni]KRL05795.1 abc superfamily atp binding cassette transporter, membrane protein [Liquorilactobacillus oeni DSM 19972]
MIRDFFKGKAVYFLSSLTPVAVFLFLHYLVGIQPFGNYTMSNGDMTNQYLALISYFRENFNHLSSLLYSYQLSLGGSFFPVWTYYLFSPINLFAKLFPSEQMPFFYEINALFNVGLSGLTMALLLYNSTYLNARVRYSDRTRKIYIAVFSTAFSLMNFFFMYYRCIFWFNSIALMPLIILGFERMLDNKGNVLYWASLSFAIISNYYIGIMLVLYLFILSIFWLIREFLIGKDTVVILKNSVKLLLMTLFSLMISAMVLIPSIISQNSVSKVPFNYKFEYLYKPIQIIGALFSQSKEQNTPIIYSCLLVTILLFCYLRNRLTSSLDRGLTISFLVVLLASTWLNTLYMMWHAFTMPNGFPNRESFCVVFTLVVIGYQTLGMIYNQKDKAIRIPFWLLLFALLAVVQLQSGKVLSGVNFLINLGGMALFCLLIWLVKLGKKPLIVAWLILGFVLADIIFSNFQVLRKSALSSTQSQAYATVVKQTNRALKKLHQKDDSFYRLGSATEMNANDPLQFNYRGISNYVSQQSTENTNFLSAAGYYQKHGWIRWARYNNGSTLFMDSILGIKYVLAANGNDFNQALEKTNNALKAQNTKPALQYKHSYFRDGSISVYKNETYFPLAFPVNEKINQFKLSYDSLGNPFEEQNELWKAMFSARTALYSTQRYQKQITPKSADIKVRASKSGLVYLYLPTNQWEMNIPGVKVWTNGKYTTTLFKNAEAENGIICLGKFQKGDIVQIKLEPVNNNSIKKVQLLMPLVAVERTALLKQVRQQVSKQVKVVKLKGNQIVFKTNAQFKGGKIFLSVPYDKGWSTNIGSKTLISKAAGHLMTVSVPAGRHRVFLKYEVAGLRSGILISLLGLVLAVVTSGFFYFQKLKRTSSRK